MLALHAISAMMLDGLTVAVVIAGIASIVAIAYLKVR